MLPKETKMVCLVGNLTLILKQNSETVNVTEDFDEAHLNIKLKGASKLTDKSKSNH